MMNSSLFDFKDHNLTNGCIVYDNPLLGYQIYYIAVGGLFLCLVGMLESCILLRLFLHRPYYLQSPFFYLALLSLSDLLHCFLYIAVFCVVTTFEYYKSDFLQALWAAYVIPSTTLDGILLTASAYFLVAASFERFIYSTISNWSNCKRRILRYFIMTGILLLSVLLNAHLGLYMVMVEKPECTLPLTRYALDISPLARESYFFSQIWSFWVKTIFTSLVPFFLLLSLNLLPILLSKIRLRRFSQTSRNGHILSDGFQQCNWIVATRRWAKTAKERVQKANTRSIVSIAIGYLIVDGYNVFLSAWEMISIESLRERETFYTLSSDLISLFTVLSSVSRLPIYWLCDVTFRREIRSCLFGKVRTQSKKSCKRKHGVSQPYSTLNGNSEPRLSGVVDNLLLLKRSATVEVRDQVQIKKCDFQQRLQRDYNPERLL